LAALVWRLDRRWGVMVVSIALTAAVIYLKLVSFPAIDAAASARPLWLRIAAKRDRVCVEDLHRNWRYGLNYYSLEPLPDCALAPRPVHVIQAAGAPASLTGE
jgi:hypothetical protein